MPFSQSSQISTIIQYIEKINPESILDVGVGMGQYGFLSRINLENLNLFNIKGAHAEQRDKKEWRVRIDGIEGYAGYLTPVHDYCYNEIIIGDALKVLPAIPDNSYELVIAIDILEHFTTEEGLIFLAELKRVASHYCLISTPKDFIHQEVEANPLENHRSLWTKNDLMSHGFTLFLDNQESLIHIYQKSGAEKSGSGCG